MKYRALPLFSMFLFSFQIYAGEVVGLFSNTLNTSIFLCDENNKFYRTVEPDQQIPLRMNTFIVYMSQNEKGIKSSNNEGYFYSFAYYDNEKEDKRLFTFQNIQHYRSTVYNVATGALVPQSPETIEFLKERLAQIQVYNSAN